MYHSGSTSWGLDADSNGMRLGITPRGDYLSAELGKSDSRGVFLIPNVTNALTQPTLSGPTVVGGVVQNNVTVVSGGSNWVQVPICTVTGDGTGATCTATYNSTTLTVAGVSITNGGSGYTTASVALSGGQDSNLSLSAHGSGTLQLNFPTSGRAYTGGIGGVTFHDGVNLKPVARVDALGCIAWGENTSETKGGKFCQGAAPFINSNNYVFPDLGGTQHVLTQESAPALSYQSWWSPTVGYGSTAGRAISQNQTRLFAYEVGNVVANFIGFRIVGTDTNAANHYNIIVYNLLGHVVRQTGAIVAGTGSAFATAGYAELALTGGSTNQVPAATYLIAITSDCASGCATFGVTNPTGMVVPYASQGAAATTGAVAVDPLIIPTKSYANYSDAWWFYIHD
jgi:hypothetical protein